MSNIVPVANSVATHSTADTFALLVKQSDILAKSLVIPNAYRNRPYDIVAAGLAGQSFGWDVMTSLRNYHVIEGTASLRPEAMLGLVRRAGHSVSLNLEDDAKNGRVAIASGRRRDTGDEHVARFSTHHAELAGLAGKKNWKQYEDSMLTWRAVSALCRVLFPDVVLGAGYVPEEIGADVDADGTPAEVDPLTPTTMPAIEAKRRLLAAVGGDKDEARRVWGDRDNSPITEDEVDAMVKATQQADVVDAVIVDEDCNTCADTGTWSSTTEDSPTELVDLGEFPDCETTDDLNYDKTGPIPFPKEPATKRAQLGAKAKPQATTNKETQQ